ncbi:MAG TPA: ribulose-phosphate 3-epimerase [Pyrinomonadaceae bacterium]|nr:ribulose-phosphate 3-epimerase [Pyrinomonadaceae bacterium]
MIEIAPSILSADFARLGEQIATVEKAGASILHVDVMDGRFVPNITIGLPVVKAISRATRLPIDAHLMIVEPGRYAEQFVKAGAQMVSIHIEADSHAHRTLSGIRQAGALAGLAMNPATPLSAVDEAIKFADYVLIMSVNPGFGGQEFIPESLEKVRRLRKMIDERGLKTRVEIDGGINSENIAEVTGAGAEIIVSGSAIFGAKDPAVALRELREATVLWV